MRVSYLKKQLLSALLLFPCAAASIEEDIMRVYGDDDMISLATGYRQPLSEAPAVATVVAAEDIEAIGATTIEEILETVAGLHVSKNRIFDDVFVTRSIFSQLNPHILFMINGVPIGDAVQGGRPLGWTLPTHNISRIEIVHGPGSALYGADAFAGTINVITKTPDEISGAEVGVLGAALIRSVVGS